MAVRVADSIKQTNNLKTFPVAYSEDIWIDKNKGSGTPNYDSIQTMYNNDELGNGGSSIQVDTMPIASEYPNEIVQYIGESGTYQNGYFYQSTSDGQNPPTYSWVQKNVQPNAESFTFNEDDFNIDSSTDKVSLLPSRRVFNGSKADWDLLSVAEKTQYGATAFTDDEGGGADIYSTNETKTNKVWIDGRPIYRKVIEVATSTNIDTTSWGIDTPLSCYGCAVYTDNDTYTFPMFASNREIYSWRLSSSQLFCTSVGWDGSWTNVKIVCEYTKTTN